MTEIYGMDWNGNETAQASVDANRAHSTDGEGVGYDWVSGNGDTGDGTGDGSEGDAAGDGVSLPRSQMFPTIAIETVLLNADVPW